MKVSLTQHFILPILCRTSSRPDSPIPVQFLPWSYVALCGRPRPGTGMMPYFPDIFDPQPTFTCTSTVQVQSSVESTSNVCKPLRDYDGVWQRFTHIWPGRLGSMCTFPGRQGLQTVSASACKLCFGKELTELANGSDYNINARARGYH